MTTLHLAVVFGTAAAVRKVLDGELNLDSTTTFSNSDLSSASSCQNQLNLSERTYGTPLSIAARHAALDKMALLLDAGADVDAAGATWGTPLQAAVKGGKADAVALLLARGADWRARRDDGTTAFHEAAERGDAAMLRRLIAASVAAAAAAGEEAESAGAAPGWAAGDGRTPLHAAAAKGHLECVRVLVEAAGVEVDGEDKLQATPLVEAAANGHEEVERYLQDKGARPRPEEDGRSVRVFMLVFEGGDKKSYVLTAKEPGSLVLRTQATVMAAVREMVDGNIFGAKPVVQIEIGPLGRMSD